MSDAVENLRRIQRNVKRAKDAGWTREQIDSYLGTEGYTPDAYRASSQRLDSLGNAEVPEIGFFGRAASSAAFNFGDEIAAGVSRLADYMTLDDEFAARQPTYDQRLAANRIGLDEYARQHPNRALAADFTGALVPAVATGGAALAARGGAAGLNAARLSTIARDAPTLGRTTAAAAGIGGAEGALSGAGAGEGTQGRLVGAGMGAGLGAAGGAGVNVALRGATGIKNALVPDTEANARRYFMNLINDEGESLAGASDELAKRAAIGVDDNIVADVMGPGFRSEMGGATSASSEFRRDLTELLNTRARGQAQRTREVLSDATGGRVMNTARESANRLAAARAQAKPLYEAFERRPAFVNDPELTRLMTERPALDSALTQTQRSLLNRGVNDPSGIEMIDRMQFNPKTLVLDTVQEPRATLTPQAIDRMGKITGMSAEAARNPSLDPAVRNVASDTMAARGDFLDRVDQLAPEYGQARRIFAGAQEYGDLSRAGRQFLDADSETAETLLRDQLGKASSAGQQGFREGTLDALSQRLDRSENVAGRINQATSRIADRGAMNRLVDAFPNLRGQPFDKLTQQLDALAQQSSTRNQNQGRNTRGATGSAVSEDVATKFTGGEIASGLFQSNPIPAITGAAARGIRSSDKQAQQEIRAAAAPMFLAQGSRNIEPYFAELATQRRGDRLYDALAYTIPGMAGSAAATSTGITSNVRNVAGELGVAQDDAIGPEREQVLKGIEQRQRLLEGSTPEEAAKLRAQIDDLRRRIGG